MKRTIFIAFVISLAVVPALAAMASCARDQRSTPDQISEATTIFLGTVVSVSNGDRTATFRVEEVWKGGPLPGKVTVHGGPEGNVATSVDRKFDKGARYLVFPMGEATQFTDNECSPTRVWSEDLAQYRPSGAVPPMGNDDATLQGGNVTPSASTASDEPGKPLGEEPKIRKPIGNKVLALIAVALLGTSLVAWLELKRRKAPSQGS